MQQFYSPGKLLISGEYVVLDGATALALPTRFGQHMEVTAIDELSIKWKSLDQEEKTWFEASYCLDQIVAGKTPDGNEVSKTLFKMLIRIAALNEQLFRGKNGYQIITKTDFPLNWGLGTSSTLLANLAKWAGVDAFKLLKDTFGGSGYDVAVAMHGSAITYQKQGFNNSALRTSFDPPFKDHLFFVFLNRKQNSRESIQQYRQQKMDFLEPTIEKVSNLTHRMITCTELKEFELLMEVHENLISQLIGRKKIKAELFADYPGAIKSLGGWGGDFVMATGSKENMAYFRKKNFDTILSFEDMILK